MFEIKFDNRCTLKVLHKCPDFDDAKAAAAPRLSLIDTVYGFSTTRCEVGQREDGKEGREAYSLPQLTGLITTRSSHWPASLHKQPKSSFDSLTLESSQIPPWWKTTRSPADLNTVRKLFIALSAAKLHIQVAVFRCKDLKDFCPCFVSTVKQSIMCHY